MLKKIIGLAVLGVTTATFSGCPALVPPFDATGAYEGTFTLGAGDTQLAQGCDISLDLTHNVNAVPLENFNVDGTVQLSFTCVASQQKATIEEILDGVLGELLTTGDVELSGAITPNGILTLTTDGIFDECPEGEQCERLVLIGTGKDTDDDGAMDTYEGTIGGLVQVSGTLVPLVGEFSTAFTE